MKRYLTGILTILGIAAFTSCDSYLINGPLDGMWQLQTIERTAPDTLITNEGDLFYSFQRHTVLIGDYNNPNELVGQLKNEQYVSLFTYEGDSITMGEFHLYYKREDQPYDTTRLRRFGLYDTHTTFHIEELTAQRLVLRSDSALLTLRKY
ncbi:MAG: lipocalin-like domain-containing protein [Bacteroidaceae bacterium]|nr:lipocalin-like domain-containing protein [Bacteroidaceae bacterium]